MARNRNPLPIPPMECPLGEEHCDLLGQVLQSCSNNRAYCEKLAAVGLDVSHWLAENNANETLAKALKEIHFPNQP